MLLLLSSSESYSCRNASLNLFVAISFLFSIVALAPEPDPYTFFPCALTIICANANFLAPTISPADIASTIAPNTGAGLPPPQIQSNKSKCASGHGTNHTKDLANCPALGNVLALPTIVTKNASINAGTRNASVSASSKLISAFIFSNSLLEQSARYQFGFLKSMASSCAINPCDAANRLASSVGDNDTFNRGKVNELLLVVVFSVLLRIILSTFRSSVNSSNKTGFSSFCETKSRSKFL